MHLLATTSGIVDGGAEAIDLNQSPGDIVVLSAADSELAALARAHSVDGGGPSLRLANLLQLQHPLSVDLHVEKTLRHAQLVVIRLLGGASYWSYGLDQVEEAARERGILLAALPGDANADPELVRRSTLEPRHCERLRQYLVAGGAANATGFLAYCRHLLDRTPEPPPAAALARAGIYRDAVRDDRPLALIVFYRSVLEGSQTEPIDAMITALEARGLAALAVHVASLKDAESCAALATALEGRAPDVILNATSFAVATGGGGDPLAGHDCPVLQVVLAGSSEAAWQASAQGIGPRDLAMNVVLPELDGRIMSRAISFKADASRDEATQCSIVTYRAVPDRVAFVADLAANWARLRRLSATARKVAIVLANYPTRDGHIANGVGYDTPASTIAILAAMTQAGYLVDNVPADGNALIESLQSARPSRGGCAALALADYHRHFDALPEAARQAVSTRWGRPEDDPFCAGGAFRLPVRLHGHVAVAIQPSRGYDIDPNATYHDPALVPPHGYLAFHFWLRHQFGAHAVIHNGKHGNLEWLPGKAHALTDACFPEIALGPLPQIYPFIVNDPGEGSQAKRRTSAVIVDHLTPPLT
ncbi:MAG: cobaltochelatase subunit CobN, partial [Alphaproteobacteria bacterium]|nr:cobaltochelatase subunit CobN [Alphaproteobacteria bacterium]